MTKIAERNMDIDEYGRQTAHDKAGRATLARDLFLLAILFLAGSGAAYYYGWTVIAAGLFVVFLVVQSVASETRLEIAMIDANRPLALLIHQQGREIEQLHTALKQQEFVRTR